jgi:hypothetical protein
MGVELPDKIVMLVTYSEPGVKGKLFVLLFAG